MGAEAGPKAPDPVSRVPLYSITSKANPNRRENWGFT